MKRIAGAVAAFAFAGIVACIPAAAEPIPTTHGVGDPCIGADIGRKDVAPDGQAIICDSNYHWEPYVGQVPNDPWVSGQN